MQDDAGVRDWGGKEENKLKGCMVGLWILVLSTPLELDRHSTCTFNTCGGGGGGGGEYVIPVLG